MEGFKEVAYDLSNKKKVKIGIWPEKNLPLVHIREYFSKGNEEFPSQKGIALTVEQWKRLVADMPDMDDDVSEMVDSVENEQSSFFSQGDDVFGSSQVAYGNSRGLLTGQQMQHRHY